MEIIIDIFESGKNKVNESIEIKANINPNKVNKLGAIQEGIKYF